MDWIPEKVLQRYVVENFHRFQDEFYTKFNAKISYARHNKPVDKYPDVYFVLEDKQEYQLRSNGKQNFDGIMDNLL